MMVLDFPVAAWLHCLMDDDKAELIRQLYTWVGMAMEDASSIAIDLGSPQSEFSIEEIAKVEAAATNIAHLLKAARSLQE